MNGYWWPYPTLPAELGKYSTYPMPVNHGGLAADRSLDAHGADRLDHLDRTGLAGGRCVRLRRGVDGRRICLTSREGFDTTNFQGQAETPRIAGVRIRPTTRKPAHAPSANAGRKLVVSDEMEVRGENNTSRCAFGLGVCRRAPRATRLNTP